MPIERFIVEPGDATMYTVLVGLIPATKRSATKLVFGFGVGDQSGGWLLWDAACIPYFNFAYFQSKIGRHIGLGKEAMHPTQVAFSLFLHVIEQQRDMRDAWERESDFKPDWIAKSGIPTLTQLVQAEVTQ
jgi:hypothetical protein